MWKKQGQLGQVAINRDAVTRESANGSTGKTRHAADRPAYVSRTAKGLPSIAEIASCEVYRIKGPGIYRRCEVKAIPYLC